MDVINLTTNHKIMSNIRVAKTFLQRMWGLLGKASLEQGGLYIPGCSSIHTFFMQFSIDVVFIDKHFAITKCISCLAPFRAAFGTWTTIGTLELPCGTLRKVQCKPGDIIKITDRVYTD